MKMKFFPKTSKCRVTAHKNRVRVYTGKRFGSVTLINGATVEQARKAIDGIPTGFDTLQSLRSANLLKGPRNA